MQDALYRDGGDGWFEATERCRGPWDPDAQHGGPVSALVARALERELDGIGADAAFVPARVTVQLLRPVPLAPVRVRARVRRPGRRIAYVEATVEDDGGRELVVAGAMGIRRLPDDLAAGTGAPLELPDAGPGLDVSSPSGGVSFNTDALEWRMVGGSFRTPGPATAWIRLTVPVVAGEAASPLQRVMAVADVGNGLSSWFEFTEAIFLNTDLSVALVREPASDWLGVAAHSVVGPDGVGLAETTLYDTAGMVGRGSQALLVERR